MKDDVLRELYDNTLSTDPDSLRNLDEYREAKKYLDEFLNKMLLKKYETVDDLYDDISSAFAGVRYCENRENFILGWKLGAKFAIASLTDE